MARLSFFNDIFREPWLMEPQTAAAQRQVLRGILMGLSLAPFNDGRAQSTVGHGQSPAIPEGSGVNVVELTGTMFRDDTECGQKGTRTLAAMLREADRDRSVIGHILRIDSGGGAANSVPDLAEAIRDCRKPVVAFVDGYMCSAAMYVGSYCDHIVANRGDDRVGCIGTMIQLADFPRQAKDADGMVYLRIYADGSEEKNSEYEAALEGDFSLIKERVLNPVNERFKADIRRNRPSVTDEQLRGRTYYASEAVGTLIDAIGGFDTAVAKVVELSDTITNIATMEGYNRIQQLDSCRELQMVDGTVTLTGEQLSDIENALDASAVHAAEAESRAAEAQAALDDTRAQLATAQARVGELERHSEEQASENERLHNVLSSLENRPLQPAQPGHNGNHLAEPDLNENPSEYCRNLIERRNG